MKHKHGIGWWWMDGRDWMLWSVAMLVVAVFAIGGTLASVWLAIHIGQWMGWL